VDQLASSTANAPVTSPMGASSPVAVPAPTTWEDDPLWFKDAIIYELPVKAFFDSNNDGMGDFRGLTEKLDYLQELGVNTLWLLPFYPSPMRDDGYDISDYHNIHPAYGTRHDFRHFGREAHRRGFKIITELVINHTSDQHPWFQAARRAPPGSSKRDYYVWSKSVKRYSGTRIIFQDSETSNWAWDDLAKAYYWHRFFSHQPDLNFANPRVLRTVIHTMRFWLDMGVDGLRLDAIPYLCEREGTINENLPETHGVIKEIRRQLDETYGNKMLLAEANQWPEDVREYFGTGDEFHMAYHFPLMPRLFMAIAQEDRHPVIDILRQTPDIPDNCQWAIFLRNHDELTLEMVTDRERDYMYQIYAVDPRMRVNVGIRRRLAPLMENDRRRIELISCLLMTMPGSPILYYGDEIGMGDNIFLGDRNGVRTPMQWNSERNAGFSRADPQRLYLPPIMDPVYGYQAVNVEAQARNPTSLLNWTTRLIQIRKSYRAFGRGTLAFLEPGNRKILAYLREYQDDSILCVANLSRNPQAVELDMSRYKGRVPVELFGKVSFPPVGELPYMLTLPGHGFYAFRLSADAPVPEWHEEKLPSQELPVLVLLEGLRTFFDDVSTAKSVRQMIASRTREQLERQVLVPHLLKRRWFAAKGERITRIEIIDEGEWTTPEGGWLLTFLEVKIADAPSQLYFLPLGAAWEERGSDPLHQYGPWTLARVRQKEKMGILYDAFGDARFCRALARAMGEPNEMRFADGRLRFGCSSAYAQLADGINEEVKHPSLEQSNTGVMFGTKLYLKGYRRLQTGINPEVEVGRFLTEVSPFPNIAPVLGWVEYVRPDGELMALALLQQYVENQGSAWSLTHDYLQRLTQRLFTPVEAATENAQHEVEQHGFFLAGAQRLGQRIGEMHRAFAKPTDDLAFAPEPVSAEETAQWVQRIYRDAGATLDLLSQQLDRLREPQRRTAEELLARGATLLERLQRTTLKTPDFVKTRYHGDLHLGQVLLTGQDFLIVDFEGEPARPLSERRAKGSPLRDVAGMIRSIDYAAALGLEDNDEQPAEKRAAIEKAIHTWQAECTQAFLAGYRAASAELPSLPHDPQMWQQLLELFLIEKALYELRYEINMRPDWVGVPLRGLLALVSERAVDTADAG
jgi:maltose alpha-D-glucosyltransferase/alpha-amylase